MPEPVVIRLGKPGENSVRIGEVDVTRLVRRCTVTAEAGHAPTVSLDMLGYVTVDGADVQLPLGLTELLERLGWTPPGPRVFSPADVETAAEALWVYWHRNTRWEAEGWSAQRAHEQQAYRDKARFTLRSLGTVDEVGITAKLSDVVNVPLSVTEATPADPTAWRYEPDSTPRPTDGG